MSAETLNDPILGKLTRQAPNHRVTGIRWARQDWLTPKHRITLVFDQWYPEAPDVAEQVVRARQVYQLIKEQEHELRLRAATHLDNECNGSWTQSPKRDPADLARKLILVRIRVFGDGSAHGIFHAPTPFADREVWAGVQPDGTFGAVNHFRREEAGGP